VEIAFRVAGLDWQGRVRQDPALLRPAEVDHLVGDASKARRVLGWKPEIGFPALVDLMGRPDLQRLRAHGWADAGPRAGRLGGCRGAVGADAVAEHGHEVHGVARRPPEPGRLGGAPLEFHRGDVCDPPGLARLVADVAPAGIVHLAALADPAAAERDPEATYR